MAATDRAQRPVAVAQEAGAAHRRRSRIARFAGRDYLTLAVALVAHAILFLAILPNTHEDVVVRGFIHLSYHDSGRALSGAIPYRDFLLEYPPGTLLFMLVPRVLATGYLSYRSLFFWETAVLDAIVVVMIWASARTALVSPLRVVLLYTLAVVLLGPTVVYRLDLAPVALTAIAVLAWQRDRPRLAALALAAGAATKAYPLMLLPPLLLEQWMRGGLRRVWGPVIAFVLMAMLWLSPLLLALVVAGPQPVLHDVRFQTNRHTQVESIWATVPLLLHLTTGFALQVADRARALVILGPGDALGGLGTPAVVAAALVIYWLWWRARRRPEVRGAILLAGTAGLVLSAAILSKVLSPQYLLWAMPPLALLPLRPRRAVIVLVAFYVALPLTQWIYPLHYGDLVRLLLPAPVLMLATRNLLLVLALAALVSSLWALGTRRPA